jgi:hypothetical protein
MSWLVALKDGGRLEGAMIVTRAERKTAWCVGESSLMLEEY